MWGSTYQMKEQYERKPKHTEYKLSKTDIPNMNEFEFDEVVSILLGVKPEKTNSSFGVQNRLKFLS